MEDFYQKGKKTAQIEEIKSNVTATETMAVTQASRLYVYYEFSSMSAAAASTSKQYIICLWPWMLS